MDIDSVRVSASICVKGCHCVLCVVDVVDVLCLGSGCVVMECSDPEKVL